MKQEVESLKAGKCLIIALACGIAAISPVQAQEQAADQFTAEDAANTEALFEDMERHGRMARSVEEAEEGVVVPSSTSEVVCPIGGEVFTYTSLPTLEPDAVRLDFRGVRDDGQLVQPLPVPVCPGNGLPVYRTEFDPALKARLEEYMQTEEWKTLRAEHGDFYVIAKLLEKLDPQEDQNGTLTFAYLNAAWEIEGQDEEKFKAYYREALGWLDKVLAGEFANPADIWALSLLGVDIARRIGDFDEASERLDSLPFQAMPDNARIRLTYSYERELIIDQDSGAYMIRRPTGEEAAQ